MKYLIPENEEKRIDSLYSYQILDTYREETYDDISEMAAWISGCPVAYIGFIDKKRQWLKSSYRLPNQYFDIPRELTFCSYTIFENDTVVIENTLEDERFKNHPSVTGEAHIRFYCGIPLINKENFAIGTLCVVGFEPLKISDGTIDKLKKLSQLVMQLLELHKSLSILNELKKGQEIEKTKYNNLLLNILPKSIAEELKENKKVLPRYKESTTLLFAKFNHESNVLKEPIKIVEDLNLYVCAYDEINSRLKIEKIKTIGNVYMAACGVPDSDRAHILKSCISALNLKHYMAKVNKHHKKLRMASCDLSVGIYSGPVITGVVGKSKFTYDLWGDSVNSAKRILETCGPNEISVSEEIAFKAKDYFEFQERGMVQVKHMPSFKMYYLKRLKPQYCQDDFGFLPNESMARVLESF